LVTPPSFALANPSCQSGIIGIVLKKATRFITFLLTLVIILVTPSSPAHAQTKPWSGRCVGTAEYQSDLGTVATIQGLECLVANILSVFIAFIGLAGFVMLVIGSYHYLVSGNNSKGTETARNTLTYAVIGLVVALSSFIILNLISDFTGVDELLKFEIQTQNQQ
jgi:hypothetical protein